MADAKTSANDLDEVILVGGSTRIPAVQALVRRLTGGKDPNMTVNPDEVVALAHELETRIGRALLSGELQRGAVIRVDTRNGELEVRFAPEHAVAS